MSHDMIDTKDSDISSSTGLEENQIFQQLIELGYDKIYSRRIFYYFHPINLEEALNYFDMKNGLIQHRFIKNMRDLLDENCYICGLNEKFHLKDVNINEVNNILENDIKSIDSNIILINDSLEIKSKNYFNIININNTSNYKTEIIVCHICGDKFKVTEENKLKNCGHKFCDECWYDSLSIKIKENKLSSIKCLDYNCKQKLEDEFIINLLNNDINLIKKYKKYKKELIIAQDPNKKFCPFPDCDSYLELKNKKEKYISCLNNHLYCFVCLKKPHGKLPCDKKNIKEKDMTQYAKNNFVKKCPNCGTTIEKNDGCNHITCSKCGHQWCWLCNQKFSHDHYKKGICKGPQSFVPKNDYKIKIITKDKISKDELSNSPIKHNILDAMFYFLNIRLVNHKCGFRKVNINKIFNKFRNDIRSQIKEEFSVEIEKEKKCESPRNDPSDYPEFYGEFRKPIAQNRNIYISDEDYIYLNLNKKIKNFYIIFYLLFGHIFFMKKYLKTFQILTFFVITISLFLPLLYIKIVLFPILILFFGYKEFILINHLLIKRLENNKNNHGITRLM